MPAAAPLTAADEDLVARFRTELIAGGGRAWRSTCQAAATFCRRIARSGGWQRMDLADQLAAAKAAHAAPFVSWLIVTGRLPVSAAFVTGCGLQLGHAAARYQPAARLRFEQAAERLDTTHADTLLQWHALVMLTAAVGRIVTEVNTETFQTGRDLLLGGYRTRDRPASGRALAAVLHRLQATLFHDKQVDTIARPAPTPIRVAGWAGVATSYQDAAQRYVEQVALSLRPSTVTAIERDLRFFGRWLADHHPDIVTLAQLTRCHLEDYKSHLATAPSHSGAPLKRVSIKNILINLRCFFTRITEWGYPDIPVRPLLFDADLPIIDKPLPRFLDDAAATKLLRAARTEPDPFTRLVVELLARTGMRKGELLALTVDAVVQIGSAFWLRIPIGKLHNDRYIPLHPELKTLLDDWITHHRPADLRSNLLLVHRGRPVRAGRVDRALARLANTAGIGHVTAHQLRHTLATQAINRGMSLDAIAALLGHKTLAMTMIYARIADRTVAEEYFAVTEKVEALYDQPTQLPADDEGHEMRRLRAEMHRRMLGNGYCARPVDMDCHFESICESCTFFVTTIEFRPTLQAQRDDAHGKGQIGRQKVFDGLLQRLDQTGA
ncbi:tyrosine-type recombinase/integrase [Pseudonocardia sp.]|uniref:tyrosine-type recombinase/integrase n=1 Tax=Pseudonocardia sp. TaxID=60912 RepID=UPI0026102DE5|nr:tyrosine-type recombinase/integrase [Pseudonocardia sp.]